MMISRNRNAGEVDFVSTAFLCAVNHRRNDLISLLYSYYESDSALSPVITLLQLCDSPLGNDWPWLGL